MVAMGKIYNQLNIEDRVMIGMLKSEGKSLREIGLELGRSHSTIVRELRRNSPAIRTSYYLAHKADERADERKRIAGQRERLKSRRIRRYVERKIGRASCRERV